MRRWLAAWLLCLALPIALAAQDSQDTGWTITAFDATYRINRDGTISVAERIAVDFGSLERHGIYREIPIKYRKVPPEGSTATGETETVDISDIVVTDDDGTALGTKVTRGARARIRIGDPDRTISGPQVYIIRYRIARGVGFFEDHDELYWQVTGTEWPVPILEASATVSIEGRGAEPTGWAAECYAGWAESNSSARCTARVDDMGGWHFGSGRLEPGEGLTMVASFPKGIIPPPTVVDAAARGVTLFWPATIPFVVFGLMYSVWNRTGRDPEKGAVVPYWRVPEGLHAGVAGTLYDMSAGMDDIVAMILDLGVRGFLRIKEVPPDGLLGGVDPDSFTGKALRTLGITKTDWELERINVAGEGALSTSEQLLLDGLFDGGSTRRMSELHNEFYKTIPKINKALYRETVEQGLFRADPNAVRARYIVLGAILIAIGVVVGNILQNFLLLGAVVLGGIVVLGFANLMPARTLKGARQWEQMRGLEEYIRRAEKLELEMHQGPEKTTELFERLLPFAVAFDVSDIWVKQFGPILAANPPTWYVGMHPGRFDAGSFSDSLSGFQSAAGKTLGSSPGSSSGSGGGGSVGGGGGGGGGGSW
ncbi:MAG: DUF2207 domain-containing protein [Gemmatimonadales bacterium]